MLISLMIIIHNEMKLFSIIALFVIAQCRRVRVQSCVL